jgi:hypothetical protein
MLIKRAVAIPEKTSRLEEESAALKHSQPPGFTSKSVGEFASRKREAYQRHFCLANSPTFLPGLREGLGPGLYFVVSVSTSQRNRLRNKI